MFKTKLFTLVLFAFCFGSLFGQEHTCGFDHLLDQNPNYKAALIKQTQEFKAEFKRNSLRRNFSYSYDTTYIFKVVFHVLYNNSLENIPDSCLHSQIEVLNEDFNRTNPDTGNTRAIFNDVAGKLQFKFVLADKDPNGNSHTGIIRKSTNITSFSQSSGGQNDARMKFTAQGGSDAWNTDEYLNIWVCDMYPPGGGSFTAGYATPPTGAEHWPSNVQFPKSQQGAVVHYYTVGRYNPRATANGANALGRTTTHELGHFFGLFHTWGLQSGTCATSADDFIDDTPNSASPNSGCNPNRNSCQAGNPGDLPDMIENYMDYTRGSCQNMFSEQQSALMLYNLKMYRKDLYSLDLEKDSTFEGNINPKPNLVFNPKEYLVISADKFTQTSFKLSIYNSVGQYIIEDRTIVIDKIVELKETQALNYGHYFIKLVNTSNNEETVLRWINLAD